MPRLIQDGAVPGAGGGVSIGDISIFAPFTQDIAGVTAPADGTLASTAIDTLDYSASATNGQRFEFKIPDDYDSGDLKLKVTYADDTADSGNFYISTAAEIAKVSDGSIDTGSYPETNQSLAAPTSADIPYRATILSISATDFGIGDTIQFFVKRKGADGSDTATGLWQVIAFELGYTGQVATRNTDIMNGIFSDTDETPASSGTKGNFDTVDFSGSADNEQKFFFTVPDNWDEMSDAQVRITYAMSTSSASDVDLRTEGDIADLSGATTTTFAAEDFSINTTADTNIHRSVVIRSIPAASLGKGDAVEFKLKRLGSTDGHAGNLQLISATINFGIGPKTGFDQVVVEGHYLYAYDYTQVAGSPTCVQEEATYSGDFESWIKLTGAGASEQIDLSFPGRLMSTQTAIKSIKVPYKASTTSLTYNLKVYVEDGSASTPAYASGDTAPGGTSRTVISKTDADLGGRQPEFASGREGRFFIVIEAKLDGGEILRVGRPFVGLE